MLILIQDEYLKEYIMECPFCKKRLTWAMDNDPPNLCCSCKSNLVRLYPQYLSKFDLARQQYHLNGPGTEKGELL